MSYKLLLLFLASALSFKSYGSFENTWIEMGGGSGGVNFKIKTFEQNTGWAIEGNSYRKTYGPVFSNTIYDRATGEDVEPEFDAINVYKTWVWPYRLGYVDVGLGLGAGRGDWANDCKEVEEDSGGFSFNLGSSYECDINQGTRIGIPLQASAVFGKYLGIGISFNVFLSKNAKLGQLLFTIPIGSFTK